MRHRTTATAGAALIALLLLSFAACAATDEVSLGRRVGVAAEAYLRYSVGRLMELQGAFPEALVQYRRAASLQPGECAIQTAVARVLFTQGRLDDAEASAKNALERCPDSRETLALYAAVLLSNDRFEETEALLRGPAEAPGAPVELVMLLGESLAAQHRSADALEVLAARAERDSLSPRIAYAHAGALLDLGRVDEAVDELRRANRLDPQNGVVVELCTTVLASEGRDEEAAAMLESFLDTPGAGPRHVAALARAYGRLGRVDRALQVAAGGLDRFGESPDILKVLGSIQLDEGDVDSAVETYERVLALEPDSVQALNFIAYTLADNNRDIERAIDLAERAVELEPDSGIVLDTLGWAYYRAGRFEDAVGELTEAVAQGGMDAVILEHLGDALEAVGRPEDAVVAWQQALSLDPENGPSAKVERVRAELDRTRGGGGHE